MAALIFASLAARGLKETLNNIITDKHFKKADLVCPKWCEIGTMDDAFEDDSEYGGPGLVAEKEEGAEISMGTIAEGRLTRFIARTFALKLAITEEALEDNKYKKILDQKARLIRALWKTVDIDTTNMLVRGFNSEFTFGSDGQPLWSDSHPLPRGGTFSNILPTPISPSPLALISLWNLCQKLPGHDGVIEGYTMKKILCPTEQVLKWNEIIKSEKNPNAGEFNAINVTNSQHSLMDLDVVGNKFWTNTTTNYAVTTDAPNGLKLLWRRKPRNKAWVNNDSEVMLYSISARFSRGTSEPRQCVGVEA